MTIVQSNTALVTPTLTQLVSDIRRSVTKEAIVTLASDPVNDIIVKAINDAVADIYYRNRWNWARAQGNIILVSGQSQYPLPADFRCMAMEPVVNYVQIQEVPPEEWWRNTYTPSWNSNSALGGQPSKYMVDMALLQFWPMPSDSFIAANPSIPIIYYRLPPARLTIAADAANSPNVPPQFIELLECFGIGKLKVFLQYDDFAVDLKRYDDLLQNRIQIDMISAHPTRMRPRNWRSANFG